jgi:hypothetical protein
VSLYLTKIVKSYKMEGKKKSRQRFSERVIDLWKVLNSSIRSILLLMGTTDFGKNGINEAGFKAIVIASLIPLLDTKTSESVHSEVAVEGGYMDVVVIFPKFNGALVIELKYLQLLYFKATRWQAIGRAKTGKLERQLLEEDLRPFRSLKVESLKGIMYRNPKTKQYDSSIIDCVKKAREQALDYAKSLRDGGLTPFNPKPQTIYYGVIIGCACSNVYGIKRL